jgi:ribosome maturation factor RimP
MDLAEEVKKIAEQHLATGQFLVDVIVTAKKGPKKVMILADADQGFTIDDCATLSRLVSKELDDKGLIDDNYFLEVSTPGVDHPLKLNRQFVKNIGRSLKVRLKETTVEGKLTEVTADKIVLLQEIGSGKKKETKSEELLIADIEKAFVQISFK